MGLNNEKKTNDLGNIIQNKWEDFFKDSNIQSLSLPPEQHKMLRMAFKSAYQEGQVDMLSQMQEIYDNDVDLFQEIFETDNDSKLFS